MPSRRQLLAALGSTAAVGSLAGCTSDDATTGTVTRKEVTVGVPRRTGDPVDASVALLAFEPDRRLVHGEYDPDYAGAAVDGGTLSVPRSLHGRLADQFASVRYTVNVVPADGDPANGPVERTAFDALPLGGTATVAPYTGGDGWGRLHVRESTPPDRPPAAVTVGRFDLDERLNRK